MSLLSNRTVGGIGADMTEERAQGQREEEKREKKISPLSHYRHRERALLATFPFSFSLSRSLFFPRFSPLSSHNAARGLSARGCCCRQAAAASLRCRGQSQRKVFSFFLFFSFCLLDSYEITISNRVAKRRFCSQNRRANVGAACQRSK